MEHFGLLDARSEGRAELKADYLKSPMMPCSVLSHFAHVFFGQCSWQCDAVRAFLCYIFVEWSSLDQRTALCIA